MKSKDILTALSNRFVPPKWCFLTEIQLEPGFSNQRRVDGVAINSWPSGKYGHSILGFEIKVSRADFGNDIKDPEKFRQTYKFCDRAYYVCPDGLLDILEIPQDAGLITVKESLEVEIWESRFVKKTTDIPRALLASIARKMDPRHYEWKMTLMKRQHAREIRRITRGY